MTMTATDPERGEIWWVDFEPAVGSEPRKTRPAVVVSIEALARLRTRLVVPLTTWQSRHGTQANKVFVARDDGNQLGVDSAADIALLSSVSTLRFGERMGLIDELVLYKISAAISVAVGHPVEPR
ncbi:MAG: type II toxin-antitoxin system PemK/MazF family toxin [Dehalococcoidia bacterium]